MATSNTPRSIRFDTEVDQKISALMKTFDESAVKVLHSGDFGELIA